MILFRHTRWKRYKTAWVWLHVRGSHRRVISMLLNRNVWHGPYRVRCRVLWEDKKPYVWVRRPGWEKARRYLAPDGKVPGRSVTWSCAYPERPLWYPDGKVFTQEELNPDGVVYLHAGFQPVAQGVHQGVYPNIYRVQAQQPIQGIIRQAVVDVGDGVALHAIAHPVPADPGCFEDDFLEDDDPDHGEEG